MYCGKRIKVQNMAEHISTRRVRLTELESVNLKAGTAVYTVTGTPLKAKRQATGWFLTGTRA